MDSYFSRTSLLLGEEALDKLSKKKIIIFGLGGVGGYCVEALVRSGIKSFTLVDNDVVSSSNLNRQIIATRKTIGRKIQKELDALIPRLVSDFISHCATSLAIKNCLKHFLGFDPGGFSAGPHYLIFLENRDQLVLCHEILCLGVELHRKSRMPLIHLVIRQESVLAHLKIGDVFIPFWRILKLIIRKFDPQLREDQIDEIIAHSFIPSTSLTNCWETLSLTEPMCGNALERLPVPAMMCPNSRRCVS